MQNCGSNHPLKCRVRAKAMDEGKVWYDHANHVWMWDWGGYPSPVTHCAGCGCPLPVMGQIVKRVLRGDTPWDATLGNPEE
jgi:hypothetical protein